MAEELVTKTCGNCKYYTVIDITNIQSGKGECRRFPPNFFMAPDPRVGFAVMCGFPQVSRGFPACGEHKTKVELQ